MLSSVIYTNQIITLQSENGLDSNRINSWLLITWTLMPISILWNIVAEDTEVQVHNVFHHHYFQVLSISHKILKMLWIMNFDRYGLDYYHLCNFLNIYENTGGCWNSKTLLHYVKEWGSSFLPIHQHNLN